jgi:hypothetical protein
LGASVIWGEQESTGRKSSLGVSLLVSGLADDRAVSQ